MKSSTRITQPEKRQAGAATLLMATVLLMAVSMIGVYSTRSGVVETRVAANAIWSQQALDTGQAALDNLLAVNQERLQALAAGATKIRLSNDSNDKTAQNGAGIISAPANTKYTAEITSTDNFRNADIRMTIMGPGNASEKVLVQRATFGPYLKVRVPLITAPEKINNPPAKCKSPPTVPVGCPRKAAMMSKAVNNTTAAVAVPDLPTVSELVVPAGFGMTPAQLEANYFSDSAAHLRETAALYLDCTATACTDADIPTGQTGLIWVDGSITLGSSAKNARPRVLGDPGNDPDGKDSRPVLLVVSGKRLTNGTWVAADLNVVNATITGLVYTRGNWDNGTGSGTINGAVLVNGTGNGTTNDAIGNATGNFTNVNLDLNYNGWVIDNVRALGSYARVAGTWRDF